MANRRSTEALARRAQERFARGFVSSSGRRDRVRAENINILMHDELAESLEKAFGYVEMSVVQKYDRGEVLNSSRGDGSLQRRPTD